MRSWSRVAVLAAAVPLVSAACNGVGSTSGSAFDNGSPGAPSGSGSGGGGATFNGGDASTSQPLPPEQKNEGLYQSPVATGQLVWIANPTSGRVAYIDAKTFAVQTVEAGDGPTYLAAVPDPTDDVAIVINARSHDATLLRDHQGTLSTRTYASTSDANSWGVSASGRWAIAWTNATTITNTDPTQGFQDVAVLDLSAATPKSTVLAVGYRPAQVAFSADGARAFAVTQDGISVIDLVSGPQPTVTENFPLSAPTVIVSTEDASADAAADADASTAPVTSGPSGAPDVSFTPDGAYALVRNDGLAAITIVTLANGNLTTVPLASAPTDLTLSPAGDFALAVMRETSTVAILPMPAIVANPTSFTTVTVAGETIGRAIVTQGGKSALLFTTAAPVDDISVLTFAPSPSVRTIALHAPVLAVFPTPDAKNAIVLNSVSPTSGSNVKGAFSIVPIAQNLPAKIVGVPAPPTAVALSPTSDTALVSIRDDSSSTYGLYLAAMPSLATTPYTLASPPIAVGMVAGAGRGYAAQDYDEGRITFVDLAGGAVRTITGFELGSRVDDGSNP